MKALVLAAGLGTRLGALTRHTPKPMLPVGGKPLLEHIVELLRRHGIADVAINLHHKPDVILRHFGSGEAWSVRLRYSYEAVLLGTAGAALRHLAWLYPDPFLVYYGDVYSDVNLTDLIERHRTSGAAATLVVYQADHPTPPTPPREASHTHKGVVEFDASGRVQRFAEEPPAEAALSNWTNAGIYVLNPDVLRYASDIPSDFGHDVFPRLLEAGHHVQAYPIGGPLIDIDSPENYRAAQELFAATGVTSHESPPPQAAPTAHMDFAPAAT